MTSETFKAWAIVELFGHNRAAGEISEQAIGGETFIRVDIPRAEGAPYTRLFGKGAIYCINICEESTARSYAMRLSEPLYPYTALPAPATEPVEAGSFGPDERDDFGARRANRDDDDGDDFVVPGEY